MKNKLFNRYNINQLRELILDEDHPLLLIKGIPGIGKWFAAQAISKEFYKTVYSINLKYDRKKFSLPLKFINSPSEFISALEIVYRKPFAHGRTSLVIKDVHLIKDLYESLENISSRVKGLKIIATASSLDTSIFDKDQIELKPLSFFEFLCAVGKEELALNIKAAFEKEESLSENDFSLTNFLYTQYLLCGGVPASIDAFVKSRVISKAELSNSIVLDDLKTKMALVDDSNKSRLLNTFENILPSLVSPSGLFVSSSVFHKRTGMNATKTINALIDSGTAIISRQTKELTLSMPLSAKKSKFKLYYPDVGLLVTALNSMGIYKKEAIFDSLLYGTNQPSLAFVYENAVAIHLSRNHPDLYFYAWFDKMNHRSCIDFLYFSESKNITKRKIVPVMFLSPKAKTVSQFKEITRKNKSKLTRAYVLYSGNVKVEEDMTYLPYFMAELL